MNLSELNVFNYFIVNGIKEMTCSFPFVSENIDLGNFWCQHDTQNTVSLFQGEKSGSELFTATSGVPRDLPSDNQRLCGEQKYGVEY